MSHNARVILTAATTGNVNGVTAGSASGVGSVAIQNVEPGTLSALVSLLPETNTITLSAIWQVSNDGTNWYRCVDMNDGATTVFGTGTAGADTAVQRVVNAPSACSGWLYARVAVLVGVTTGATGDTYSVQYAYAKPRF